MGAFNDLFVARRIVESGRRTHRYPRVLLWLCPIVQTTNSHCYNSVFYCEVSGSARVGAGPFTWIGLELCRWYVTALLIRGVVWLRKTGPP